MQSQTNEAQVHGLNTISKTHAEWMQKHVHVEQPNNSSQMWDHLNTQ